MNKEIKFWGVTASPYQLKMQALADYCEVSWQRLPDQGLRSQSLAWLLRLTLAKKRAAVRKYPGYLAGMDEYPAVPYYSLNGKQVYYDSTGLALHLDSLQLTTNSLLPEEPVTRFLCQLFDDAFDEFGLYMVHHNRWVISAHTNVMADTTVAEMRTILPSFTHKRMKTRLSHRQVRRCPYLFSVAPSGYDCDMPPALTPPSRVGFPPTHDLLNTAWSRYLEAMENVLTRQPYLLGERFTLADASAYGQLSMNLPDGRAAQILQELAPTTFQWLCKIRDGEHRGGSGARFMTDNLTPLVKCITETYLPLMRQNEAAYENAFDMGQRLFNEAAFDQGEALYDGALMGFPFRSVAKTFQVITWRDLKMQWRELEVQHRQDLRAKFPVIANFFASD